MKFTTETACRHCGQVHIIETGRMIDDIEAADMAVEACFCDGAEAEKATTRALVAVPAMFGPDCDPAYGTPVQNEDTMTLLVSIAVLVATGKLEGVTIKLTDEQTAKFSSSKRLTITRERKRKAQRAV